MYQPAHFRQEDGAALVALMQAHPLAALVSVQDGEPTADHIPLQYDEAAQVLRGHVARANPLWRAAAGQPVLAIFRGAQAYVSPSWYPSKAEHHKVVPTWNYAVVHAHGRLRAVDDAPWLHELVSGLTARHETGRPTPWAVGDAPADFIQQMLAAIVGIEIAVERLEGKFKLSQNKSAADRAGVAAGMATGDAGAQAMAALVLPKP
ncbi:Transcriptional regulator [Rubrivivax sp. A210]|uniref:FMN-binding negative transcriptional regulator n=1 Tax=Rubrivivax sp. A210 TaxID=2772301 RepID=UPI0019190A34|nr:FMN-binding negative transcriptional regulator [Rubrivivax sp. A210]CAD5374616.1 Transcriptional regulator [Rubrivivax sp. A210]